MVIRWWIRRSRGSRTLFHRDKEIVHNSKLKDRHLSMLESGSQPSRLCTRQIGQCVVPYMNERNFFYKTCHIMPSVGIRCCEKNWTYQIFLMNEIFGRGRIWSSITPIQWCIANRTIIAPIAIAKYLLVHSLLDCLSAFAAAFAAFESLMVK